MKNKKEDKVKAAGDKVIKEHENTFLRLRVIELERELASERVTRMQLEQKVRDLKHKIADLEFGVSRAKDQTSTVLDYIDMFAGRPTKDGAKALKDLADEIRSKK